MFDTVILQTSQLQNPVNRDRKKPIDKDLTKVVISLGG